MESTVGPPSAVGGIVGSTAADPSGIYGPVTVAGYVGSNDKAGTGGSARGRRRTLGAPVAWPTTSSTRSTSRASLTRTTDASGRRYLQAADRHGDRSSPAASWGGVSVARNTVYAAVASSGLADGFIVAFKQGGGQGGGGVPMPPTLPPPPSGAPGGNTVVAGPARWRRPTPRPR